MKVELSIKDDSELRNMIKDMIKGQITGLVREEVLPYADSTMERHVMKNLPSKSAMDKKLMFI
jgi:hypothetical protein